MFSPGTTSPRTLLERALADAPAIRGLSAERYATTHTAYEAASDQRAKVQDWLVAEIPPLVAHVDARPVSVLGVGVGDGSVDAPLAARLAAEDRPVDYHGVEPHGPSLATFEARLQGLGRPRLRVTGARSDLAGFAGSGPFDVVHFVHSLYYVDDVAEAIDHALRLLRPGGALVALTSPREPLSLLASLLAPQTAHPQWFAETVSAAIADRGLRTTTATIDGRLDLSSVFDDPTGVGEQVFDFLIQARSADLGPELRRLVDAHLGDIALPGEPYLVPHPLEVVVAIAP